MCLAIFFHEVGHLTTYKIFTKEIAEVKVEKLDLCINLDHKKLGDKELLVVYYAGIVAGIIPIVFILEYLGSTITLLLLITYLTGCFYDIRQVIKLCKK